MKKKLIFKSKSVFCSTRTLVNLTIISLLISCQSELDQEFDSKDANQKQNVSIEAEMEKYASAIVINDVQEGWDITDKVLNLKSGARPENEILVTIESVGAKDNEEGMLTIKDGRIVVGKVPTVWLDEESSAEAIPDNMDIVKLKFQKGDIASDFEVLVVASKNEATKSTYTFASDESITRTGYAQGNTTYLGIGYDILKGTYINRNDAKLGRPILDINKLNAAGSIIQSASVPSSRWEDWTGESILSLFQNLNVSVDASAGIGAFSGSVKTEFKTSKESVITSRYAKGRGIHYVKDEWLIGNTNASVLRNYISSDFQNAIQQYSAAQILDYFGTHLIVRCYQGGTAEFNYSYSGSEIKTSQEFSATIKASYAPVSGSGSTSTTAKMTDLRNNSHFTCYTRGGSNTAFQNQVSFNSGYASWVSSVASKPDLCAIGNFSQCMFPIWTLIAQINPSKATAVENEYKYRSNTQISFLGSYAKFITGINVWDMGPTTVPSGYTALVSKDLYRPNDLILDANEGCGGAYIRIGYRSEQLDINHQAIADIAVLRGGNTAVPTGWTKINLDLNKGVGGEYLYLIYRKANSNDKKVIDFIGSHSAKSSPSSILIDSSWSWVKFYGTSEWAELNKGAEGRYIYLTIHKTDFKW